ncbi:23S rRNA (uracil(1939)-C(5))-methyltransferase RlmD [Aureibacter tunicatorum]|uniref:23S rRNA (Uracil1939-C5)-methyltransferase n=1 Tax=Aureibacter tunicatorum TaxID=866807 RepID=A0AAE3XMT5_9BACT|nr:23S rRNA (uracil(1939)-C(5))-methyltransferase RlmD [Aureibacter tunicatorum]MDR6238853.1 23S rRNA (uracil1939-C5)-methyltransferase [Aureibacter tunicatorum]BDD05220.1 23S rRNA (uracil-5-)-methyltransferase RumA [Aureibacter tunicatorum]
MRKRKKNVVIENIAIEDFAAEGKCVAKHEGKVIFVDHAAPGDVVDLQLTKSRKSFSEARITNFHGYSDLRIEPFCSHYGVCGGCKWQHLDYKSQLYYKTKQVRDNFEHLGKFEYPEILEAIGSEKTRYYRNKLEFTFSAARWLTVEEIREGTEQDRRGLGFHIPKHYNKVINVDHCYLQSDPSNEIRLGLAQFARENDLPFFDYRVEDGLLRNLMIRTSTTSDVMVLVQFFRNDKKEVKMVMEYLENAFPQITSLNYVINGKGNDSFHDLEVKLYSGKPYIEEQMEGLTFRVGPKSFYQTNSDQAYVLYKKTREFAELQGDETVYDLYTGTGTIANFVAKQASKVVGIEYVEEAIEDAKLNSELNGVENTTFYAGDMKKMLTRELFEKHGKPDVIITDPPRAGMDKEVVEMLLRVEANRIVYVSCNPATQARDLTLLDEKYKVVKVQPVDMFPHTHHIENVVQLELRKDA